VVKQKIHHGEHRETQRTKTSVPLRALCDKTINSPRRTQRNVEKKTSVPLCALCGKTKRIKNGNKPDN
jgi:hypothetical protein